jgi:hypothetical protein
MPKRGKIIIHQDTNVWPHELAIAKALSRFDYCVEFKPTDNTHRSADAYLNGTLFEFKSPIGTNVRSIERNIKRGRKQSSNLVISSQRMKDVQDRSIYNYLCANQERLSGISRLLFINKRGQVFDIMNKKK